MKLSTTLIHQIENSDTSKIHQKIPILLFMWEITEYNAWFKYTKMDYMILQAEKWH